MQVQNVWEYPPYPFLEQVLEHCPKAGKTYCFLWKKRDKDNRVLLQREDYTFRHPNAFKEDLRKLFNEGLISFKDLGNRISIEMISWEDMED